MRAAKLPWLETGALAITFVILVAIAASGGPGWAASSTRGVLAARLEHSASAPLYDLVAGAAAILIPAGETGFRLGILGALLAAFTAAGLVAATRALVPTQPTAGLVGALVFVLAPPVREALATPQLLAACGATWAIAAAAMHARSKSARDAATALVACMVVVGSAPWLGAALAIVVAAWLVRDHASKQLVALAIAALGALVMVLWWNAIGSVPGANASLAYAIAASGHGAGAVVVGAGLLGIAFGAQTRLRGAAWLAAIAIAVSAHEVLVGGNAVAVLAVFAIGAAIVVAAIARIVVGGAGTAKVVAVEADGDGAANATADNSRDPDPDGASWRKHGVVVACGAPLLLAALAMGVAAEDPGAAPTELATDLASALPPGPGVFVATRPASWFALQYERVVAGMRTDLVLVPPLPAQRADVIAANALRAHEIVGADAPAFGRLDARRAVPSRRGFQLTAEPPPTAAPVEPPAIYATAIGHDEAIVLALERARYEAASSRLDAAARAAGLLERFRAADLAVLAATLPSRTRPLLFGFLPLDAMPPGAWLADVFGDDLAWVAGLPLPALAASAPMPQRLLRRWQVILDGKPAADDPEIAAMGPAAVAATTEMLRVVRP